MTLSEWFLFFLVVQVIHFLGTWKLYQKAGRKAWEAAVPVYNAVILMKIINRSPWWTILLFIPIVNLIMFPVVWVETLRSFGKNSTADTLIGLFTLGFYIYYINYFEDVKYVENRSLKARSQSGDTLSSLLFAVVVATLVHTYVVQPFQIPTPSLEKTLLVGDFLFVSKNNYGARVPMTTIAAPMVHDTIPFINKKSYLPKPQLPYFRFPGFESIAHNDIVVFNWPADDVKKFFDTSSERVYKPVDKRSNYVKRCVGLPGDNISVKDGFVYVNDQKLVLSDRAKPQYVHYVYSSKGVPSNLVFEAGSTDFDRTFETQLSSQEQFEAIQQYLTGFEKLDDGRSQIKTRPNGIPEKILRDFNIVLSPVSDYKVRVNITLEGAEKLRQNKAVIDSVVRRIDKRTTAIGDMFPKGTNNWTIDNFGPLYIPQKGKTVVLDKKSLPLYERLITVYENNKLETKGDQIFVNDKPVTSYTFQQNYYWMMGDNRHYSEDSRYWGFVPEDHIVGKPVFIWMSINPDVPWSDISHKIRWERVFTTVGGSGQPVSYFKYFLILLVIYFIGNYFYKKKKAQA